ncbi:hypothetical protein [Priestia endophytica]|uniref:hypothetical protein n=1 Tax=Priestia endophytica TaxID=135735 RepID=UPI0022828BF3|nr:hypothetical protein [Priestia endophytica]MCY8231656.1 hypothetical protein [Priestia endophytica]
MSRTLDALHEKLDKLNKQIEELHRCVREYHVLREDSGLIFNVTKNLVLTGTAETYWQGNKRGQFLQEFSKSQSLMSSFVETVGTQIFQINMSIRYLEDKKSDLINQIEAEIQREREEAIEKASK